MGRVVEKASAEAPVLEGQLGKMCCLMANGRGDLVSQGLGQHFCFDLHFQACSQVPQVPGCSSLPLTEQDTSLSVAEAKQLGDRLVL